MEEAIISTIKPQWGNTHNLCKQKEASIFIENNLSYAVNEGIHKKINVNLVASHTFWYHSLGKLSQVRQV
jgi:hypothetical protein